MNKTAPMPETMSPREKVAAAVREASRSQWIDGVRVGSAKWCNHLTDAILAALASSGDHAELLRVALQDSHELTRRGLSPDVRLNEAERLAITSLIAEIAALRADNADLREHRITADLLVSTLKADKEEAERKLAEADKRNDRAADLMRQCTDPDRFEGASTLNVYANMRAWLSDLSKEAERG